MDISVQDSGHLGFLNRADTTFGMQDEHWYILFAPKAINRCRSSLKIC
jgi:hypothetical protein